MKAGALIFLALAALAGCAAQHAPPAPLPPDAPFRDEILAFEAMDRQRAPEACPILFVGSSSIRLWSSLEADMAPLPVLNRGFGGSTAAEVNLYFNRIVAPYSPRAIVLYAGENDIDQGAAPAALLEEVRRFLALKRARLGHTPLFYVAVKPSKLRFAQIERQREANALIAALAAKEDDLHFIDVAAAMLDEGKPRDIYVEDDLHMSPAGYAIWRPLVRDALERSGAAQRRCERP